MVEDRTWPGSNNQGGVAKILKVLSNETLKTYSYDVKYILENRKEKIVEECHITKHTNYVSPNKNEKKGGLASASKQPAPASNNTVSTTTSAAKQLVASSIKTNVSTTTTTTSKSNEKQLPILKDNGESFSNLTVTELKVKLRGLSLPVGGRKQELIDRLNSHYGSCTTAAAAAAASKSSSESTAKEDEAATLTETEAVKEDEANRSTENKDVAPTAMEIEGPVAAETDTHTPQTSPVAKSRSNMTLLLALLPIACFIFIPYCLLPELEISTERLLAMLFLPTLASITLGVIFIITLAYSSFIFALVMTHEGPHHHQSRGLLSEMYTAVQDMFRRQPVAAAPEGEEKLPTLREFLSDPEGFHMAFAPAFVSLLLESFNIFCYLHSCV